MINSQSIDSIHCDIALLDDDGDDGFANKTSMNLREIDVYSVHFM